MSSDEKTPQNNSPPNITSVSIWYIRYLHFFGLLPYGTGYSLTHRWQRWIPMSFSLIWLTLTSIFAYAFIRDHFTLATPRIAELEFFSLVELLNRVFSVIQTPTHIIIMCYKGKGVQRVLDLVDKFVWAHSSGEVKNAKRKSLTVLSAVGIFSVTALCSVTYYQALDDSPESLSFDYFVYGSNFKVTFHGLTAINAIGLAVCTSGDLGIPLFVALVCCSVTNVVRKLKLGLVAADLPLHKRVLEKVTMEMRHIVVMINAINATFSPIILVHAARNLMTLIAFVAALLDKAERGVDELENSFEKRRENSYMLFYRLAFHVAITAASGVMTGYSFIGFKEEVLSMKTTVQEKIAETQVSDLKFKDLMTMLDDDNLAITAGGFFHMTKELLTKVLGIGLTYFLLIYQTRDSKSDMAALLKSSVFERKMDELKQELVECRSNGSQRLAN